MPSRKLLTAKPRPVQKASKSESFAPENLSPYKVENIVQEIVTETSYEADPTASTSQKLEFYGVPGLEMTEMDSPHSIVSESTDGGSGSPVIPILPGLDMLYK